MDIGLEKELSLETADAFLARLAPLWTGPRPPSSVRLDLKRVTFIQPSAITLLATAVLRLRQQGSEITIGRPDSDKVDSYLNRIDFYELAGVAADYPWVRRDSSGRFREVVQVQSEIEGDIVVQEVLEILRGNVPGMDAIYDAIQYAFLEVVNNVFHHAHSPTHAVVCAQSYGRLGQVEIAVVDSGVGIPASLRGNPQLVDRFATDEAAIELAVKSRVTGRPTHNTGEGLFFSLEFIKRNGGKACIHSQRGALWVESGRTQSRPACLWPGTWVAFRFRTDQPVSTKAVFDQFAPPEDNLSWLFEDETRF